jgi:glycerophosphoryl diester phosphodiesterase
MGIQVHPWTLNTESEWKRALSLGVDGIITDYPRKLKAFLALN